MTGYDPVFFYWIRKCLDSIRTRNLSPDQVSFSKIENPSLSLSFVMSGNVCVVPVFLFLHFRRGKKNPVMSDICAEEMEIKGTLNPRGWTAFCF